MLSSARVQVHRDMLLFSIESNREASSENGCDSLLHKALAFEQLNFYSGAFITTENICDSIF